MSEEPTDRSKALKAMQKAFDYADEELNVPFGIAVGACIEAAWHAMAEAGFDAKASEAVLLALVGDQAQEVRDDIAALKAND